MDNVIVICADAVNRGLLGEAFAAWGVRATPVSPGLVSNALDELDDGVAPVVVLDARRNAESVFKSAAGVRHRFSSISPRPRP